VKIACAGAGPAGLYFAVLAKRRGIASELTVCERNPEKSGYGWGVTFGPELLQELHRNDPESARAIDDAAFRWRDQFVDIRGERVTYDGGVDVYNLNRPRLVEILAARARQLGVTVRYGEEITSPAQLPDADLIVAADGVSSRLRQASGNFGTQITESQDRYIWLGTDKPFRAFAYHFLETDHGWIWASTYGVEAGLSTFVVHCAERTWAGLGFDTMPIPDCLAVLGDMFKEQLDGHRLMGQVDDPANARWQSFRTVTNERWHAGNVVLAGDAAHTTHFSSGLGSTLALEDAIALAGNLGLTGNLEQGPEGTGSPKRTSSLGDALAAYERQRQAEIAPGQRQARFSGRWFSEIDRYLDLEPRQFATLLHSRRSALVPALPPRLYYQLHKASRQAPVLRQLRPAAKAIKRRLSQARPETASSR
jgi:2-polyprenyl-6-methoxyphenol hydroxylase-like FAD-dependent oxidoreductase